MSTKNFSLILKLSTQTRFEYSNTFGDTNKYFLIKNLDETSMAKLKKFSGPKFCYCVIDSRSGGLKSSSDLMKLIFPKYFENYPDSKIGHEISEDPIFILQQKFYEGNIEVIQKLDKSIPSKSICIV